MPPIKFNLNQIYCSRADVIWRLSRWLPWWLSWIYKNRTVLAILNLHAAPMPSTKFLFHLTYGSGTDNNWRLSRWLQWWSSWIRFWWRCPKFEKLLMDIWVRDRTSSTDHGISWPGAKLHLSYQLKIFKMDAVAAIIDIVTNGFSNSESPCLPNAYHRALAQSDLPFRSRWGLKIFKMATLGAILDIGTEQF